MGLYGAQDVTSASNDVEHSCSTAREHRSRFRNALNLSEGGSGFIPRLIIHVNRSLYLDPISSPPIFESRSEFDSREIKTLSN